LPGLGPIRRLVLLDPLHRRINTLGVMYQRRSVQLVTVAILTSALCADRVAAAMPSLRPNEMTSMAERLLDRLSIGLRRVVTAIRQYQARIHGRIADRLPALPMDDQDVARPQIVPFQFRLPPPASTHTI
jgi:hypothetical protein